MPEIPDLTVYIEALQQRVQSQELMGIRVANPFILRSVSPGIEEVCGQKAVGFRRIGKRIIIELTQQFYIVIHLMIAGRLRWNKTGSNIPRKIGLISFDFRSGSLLLTEASQKRRASVHLISGKEGLEPFDAGGLEVFEITLASFKEVLTKENHTLKRALTDQKFLAGIGNAYSDEILHKARLSPMLQTKRLKDADWQVLFDATRSTLDFWIKLLRDKAGSDFPDKVTAFHPEMAAHGKFKQACPDCGKPIQRIRYANNECNYCALCQNQGNILADRSLSRLLKKDWPRTLEELDQ